MKLYILLTISIGYPVAEKDLTVGYLYAQKSDLYPAASPRLSQQLVCGRDKKLKGRRHKCVFV